jgi:tetratricopeptide (TPR) repeat protein
MSLSDLFSIIAALVVIAAVGALAFWLVRSKNVEIALLKQKAVADDNDVASQQAQSQALEALNAKLESLIQHNAAAESQTADQPRQQDQAATAERLQDVREDLSQIQSLLHEMTAAPQPAASDPPATLGTTIQQALDIHEKALALDRADPTTPMNRGIVLLRMGLIDEALAAFGQALDLQPGHGTALYNRACLYALQEQPDNALDDLRTAIAGDTKFQQMARADSDFDTVRNDPRFQELVGGTA